jgi:FAD/FMN-containing dehydrogenase
VTRALNRRQFLGRGAAVAGALAGGGLLAALGTEAAAKTELDELAAKLRGTVILPASPGYRSARLVWNSRFDGARPAAVIRVADASDVRAVVDFARERQLRLIPRSGGHSFAGYSTGNDLVLDLSALAAVEIDAKRERARLGAGATTLPTYRALWRREMAISAGTCPTVGITGLTAGGGLGVLSRRDGLTCDNLLEVEVVTADGRLVRANARDNADLYWATRGGGGGNFGIVTALTFGLVPVDTPFTSLEYEFPWSAAERVLAAWQAWLPTSPRKTWSAVQLATQAPAANALPAASLEVVHAGPEHEALAIVTDLLHAVGTRPTQRAVEAGPFLAYENDSFCKGLRASECALEGKSPRGELPRPAFYAKSDVASRPWPRGGLSTLIEWIEKRQRDRTLTPRAFSPSLTIGKVLIEAADGAVNSLSPGATAFVHRDNLFVAQFQARWRRDSPRDVVDANLEWTNDFYSAVRRYRSGFAYQNYIDADLDGWQHAYYGANLARLRRVKAKYDPNNVFRFAQSIK